MYLTDSLQMVDAMRLHFVAKACEEANTKDEFIDVGLDGFFMELAPLVVALREDFDEFQEANTLLEHWNLIDNVFIPYVIRYYTEHGRMPGEVEAAEHIAERIHKAEMRKERAQ